MGFRLDRAATLYLAGPLRRFAGKRCIPILMYHSIGNEDEAGVPGYYQTVTTVSAFEEQMRFLHRGGYQAVGLAEAWNRLSQGGNVANTVVVTFDDGFRNFRSNAFPVLNRYGFTATMFLPTAFIGKTPQTFKDRECLTWGEIRELQQHGMVFGSHTVTHPKLYGMTPAAIEQELSGSKKAMEDNLGWPVDAFAYPYAFPEADGEFKRRLREMLLQTGYAIGVCTSIGRPSAASDPLFLPRLPVNSADDRRLFQAKLEGAYDWLAKPQYLVKAAKTRLKAARHGS